MTFTLVESSQRFDRNPDLMTARARRLREAGDVVIRTECGGRDYERTIRSWRIPGWDTWQSKEEAGADECAAEWREARLRVRGMPKSVPISDETYWRETGAVAPFVHALVLPLEFTLRSHKQLDVIGIHMALDNTDLRAAAWIDGCEGTVQLVRELRRQNPRARQVIAADFNKNHRSPAERAMIQKHLCDPLSMQQAWDGQDAGGPGTHGRQLIDGFLVDEDLTVVDCSVLPDPAHRDDSDHSPCAVELSWGTTRGRR